MLVSTLRMAKIKSILHTSQYADSISPDRSQVQVLVQSLSLPGITRHINMFSCKAAQKRAMGLTYTLVVSIATG